MEILNTRREHPYNAAALAGMTRRKRKRKKLSGTKGEAKGRMKLVTYCPFCPIVDMANPENSPRAVVTAFTKEASCKNGHTWEVQ